MRVLFTVSVKLEEYIMILFPFLIIIMIVFFSFSHPVPREYT